MVGHTVYKCYKIHGYPPGHKLYKGRRIDAVVQSSDGAQASLTNLEVYNIHAHTGSASTPVLTHEQYSQVLSKYNADQ